MNKQINLLFFFPKKCLLHTKEDLSLDLQYLCKKLGTVMHICKLSAGNQEKGYVMACLDGPSS